MDAPRTAPTDVADEASLTYLGRWNRLVSTTNWEKGRIIHEWREALVAAGAAATQYSDDAWARYVGNVSGQHVGRLRRVWERFGGVRDEYDGLYWSHFQAALDWDDAEMWLEGAVQSDWSVSHMRRQRWETLGGTSAEAPGDEAGEEFDEDAPSLEGDYSQVRDDGSAAEASTKAAPRTTAPSDDEAEADDDGEPMSQAVPFDDDDDMQSPASEKTPRVAPLAALPELPDDLAEAFESYKLAILHHKMAGWRDIALDDVVASLRALEQLALAP